MCHSQALQIEAHRLFQIQNKNLACCLTFLLYTLAVLNFDDADVKVS